MPEVVEVAWPKKPNTQNVSLAGEFYVLAQLALSDLVATMTLARTKSVDILVSNPRTGRVFQVEVKTKTFKPVKSGLFGFNHEWIMDQKHESIRGENLIYCFVHLPDPQSRPKFWLVPATFVADYVGDQHQKWLATKPKQRGVNTMRTFRLPVEGKSDYEENWAVFEGALPK